MRPTARMPAHLDAAVDLVRDLGMDSLELVELASALTTALHLHESGEEDRLLADTTIGGWISVARDSLATFDDALTFRTSGTVDHPASWTHPLAALGQETHELARLIGPRRRVVSAVRANHVYGFLFSVLLPRASACESADVLDCRGTLPPALPAKLRAGDLVVGYPEFWRALARADVRFPPDVTGVTSTAPCPDDVARDLDRAGLHRLLQVYGSTETGGVGSRTSPDAPYTLFPYWRTPSSGDVELRRELPDRRAIVATLQDRLEWVGERQFHPAGRVDHAIQVGGVNVHTERVRLALLEHPSVLDAVVRRGGSDALGRLKAFIVPKGEVDPNDDALHADLDRWAATRLSAPERPRSFTIGPALPRDDAGKLADWPVVPHESAGRL
jgi:4-coumarate--CoA ligase (photoactive yellow protein activation family)